MGIEKRIFVLSASIAVLLAIFHVGTAQECNTSLKGQLLLAEEGKISRVNPSNPEDREILITDANPLSVVYNQAKNTIYYSDLKTRQILAIKEKSNKAEIVVQDQEHWLPSCIAIDDESEKIYVADGFGSDIKIFDLSSGKMEGFLGLNLTTPRRIVIDKQAGYLFIAHKFQILRTNLDGSNPLVIHRKFQNLFDILSSLPSYFGRIFEFLIGKGPASKKFDMPISVSDLIIDTSTKRVYWIDSDKRNIESSDYNGQNKKVHFHDETEFSEYDTLFSSIALVNGKIYWADGYVKKVFKVDVNNANDFEVILKELKPQFVTAVDC